MPKSGFEFDILDALEGPVTETPSEEIIKEFDGSYTIEADGKIVFKNCIFNKDVSMPNSASVKYDNCKFNGIPPTQPISVSVPGDYITGHIFDPNNLSLSRWNELSDVTGTYGGSDFVACASSRNDNLCWDGTGLYPNGINPAATSRSDSVQPSGVTVEGLRGMYNHLNEAQQQDQRQFIEHSIAQSLSQFDGTPSTTETRQLISDTLSRLVEQGFVASFVIRDNTSPLEFSYDYTIPRNIAATRATVRLPYRLNSFSNSIREEIDSDM